MKWKRQGEEFYVAEFHKSRNVLRLIFSKLGVFLLGDLSFVHTNENRGMDTISRLDKTRSEDIN